MRCYLSILYGKIFSGLCWIMESAIVSADALEHRLDGGGRNQWRQINYGIKKWCIRNVILNINEGGNRE